jgi:hypothetical protein
MMTKVMLAAQPSTQPPIYNKPPRDSTTNQSKEKAHCTHALSQHGPQMPCQNANVVKALAPELAAESCSCSRIGEPLHGTERTPHIGALACEAESLPLLPRTGDCSSACIAYIQYGGNPH